MAQLWMTNEQTRKTKKDEKAQKRADAQLKKPLLTPQWSWNPITSLELLLFTWFGALIRLGYKRPLQHSDLPTLIESVKTDQTYPSFSSAWQHRLAECRKTPKGQQRLKDAETGNTAGLLFKTLYGQHYYTLLLALALQLMYSAAQFAGPQLLNRITTFLSSPTSGQRSAPTNVYIYALLMFICPMIGAVAYVHSSRLSILVQIRLRAQLTAAVYRKALKLSSRSRQQTELGRIVNLMSADVNSIMQFFYPFFNQLFSAPMLLIAAIVLLYFQIKWATFIGAFIMLLSAPSSAIFVKKLIGCRRNMLKQTDARVKLMNQLLSGIRVLKVYAWEAAQEAQIREARRRELAWLGKAIPYRVGMQTLLFAAPTIAAVVSFAVYGAVEPEQFTAPRIFTAIALFSIMRFPLIFLPFALVELGNALVSLRRVTAYLVMEERSDDVKQLGFVGVQVKDGDFYWAEPPPGKKLETVKGQKGPKPGAGKGDKAAGDKAVAAGDAAAPKGGLLQGLRGLLTFRRAQKHPAATTTVGQSASDSVAAASAAPATNNNQSTVAVPANSHVMAAGPNSKAQTGSAFHTEGKPSSTSSSDARGSTDDGKAAENTMLTSGMLDSMVDIELDGPADVAQVRAAGQVTKGAGSNDESGDRVADASWWLRDINLSVSNGELVCIVGRVGSGKSSLISALLGEMERHTGSIELGGHIAYVAQQAWIYNDTLRNNILFGKEFDPVKWLQTVEVCSLQQDLEMLPAGEETEIGEKGINLSGGQKQRISLARAVYNDADLFIFDDPLSAVDVHVGRHIFDNCITGVLHKKARLLVTNQLQYLPQADKVVYMETGRIAAQGTYEEVCKNASFYSLLTEFDSRGDSDTQAGDSSVPAPTGSLGKQASVEAAMQGDRMFGELDQAEGPQKQKQEQLRRYQQAEGQVVPDGADTVPKQSPFAAQYVQQRQASVNRAVEAEALADIASSRAVAQRGFGTTMDANYAEPAGGVSGPDVEPARPMSLAPMVGASAQPTAAGRAADRHQHRAPAPEGALNTGIYTTAPEAFPVELGDGNVEGHADQHPNVLDSEASREWRAMSLDLSGERSGAAFGCHFQRTAAPAPTSSRRLTHTHDGGSDVDEDDLMATQEWLHHQQQRQQAEAEPDTRQNSMLPQPSWGQPNSWRQRSPTQGSRRSLTVTGALGAAQLSAAHSGSIQPSTASRTLSKAGLSTHASKALTQPSRLSSKQLSSSSGSVSDGKAAPPGSQHVIGKDGVTYLKTPDGKLVIAEDREKGQVKGAVYKEYAAAYGWLSALFITVLWGSEQSVRILTNWWLSQWTANQVRYEVLSTRGVPISNPRYRYLGGYLGFAVAYVVLVCLRSITNLTSGWRASKRVHHNSLAALVRAPVSFFDTTPIGRILNRFSKDTDDMDYALPQSITELGNCLMQLAATLIFISIIQPWFLCGMVPLMVLYYFLQRYYRRSYVELQRTDATSRSPVYAHFSESLTGVETIRAYGYQTTFALKSDHQIDYNHKAYWAVKTADQWLSLRLDLIGSSLIFLTALLAITQRRSLSPSLAALTLAEVLDVTGFMKYAVQSAAMFESRFNSVERLLAYRKLEPEAPRQIEGKAMPPSWPQSGGVGYNNVWMKYRPELEPVLKGVSFKVAPGEKVGIVGRTGSGKSSLIVTLFRLVEAYEGSITLDGEDLLGLGLEDVRSRIAAIPQDPALFSGTVRSNLDPYDRHEDAELWEALGHVALKDIVAALPMGLSARVAEGGDNFSMGQRQLLCVARALLRKPKVLVADEATASVDGETDALIQRTIRANFKDSTVLTIAHRLNTILDSTKVLVMEDGKVKEFDSPANLMNIPNGVFRAMVTEAGLAPESSTIQADAGTLDAMRRLSSELMSGGLPSQ